MNILDNTNLFSHSLNLIYYRNSNANNTYLYSLATTNIAIGFESIYGFKLKLVPKTVVEMYIQISDCDQSEDNLLLKLTAPHSLTLL